MADPGAITLLLQRWSGGDAVALSELMPLVYDELRGLASGYLHDERSNHTLQATALVHEAYLRLIQQDSPWKNRSHFFGIAAQMMRRILVDHARKHAARKRPSSAGLTTIDESLTVPVGPNLDIIGLDDAMNKLQEFDEQKARVVELRFFGGLSVEETAEFLGNSTATVKRDWAIARAWLYREMRNEELR
jgi:RNA polymerase sigma factor (TIGR02999 family)